MLPGRGEKLQPVAVDLSVYKIILVNPGIHINTGWAFTQLKPEQPTVSLKEIIQQPVSEWKNFLINDFEKPVFQQYTEIAAIKDCMYNSGAVFSAMSGSGSTVFGIFDKGAYATVFFPCSLLYKGNKLTQLPVRKKLLHPLLMERG